MSGGENLAPYVIPAIGTVVVALIGAIALRINTRSGAEANRAPTAADFWRREREQREENERLSDERATFKERAHDLLWGFRRYADRVIHGGDPALTDQERSMLYPPENNGLPPELEQTQPRPDLTKKRRRKS